jgi:uncharacterized membrane protein YphA (DoxX/SURF4 family)
MGYAAYSLFSKTPPSVQQGRDALHYPRWYWVLAGVVANIGAIGLLVGLFNPVVGAAAALWIAAYFIVATLTHIIRADWAHFYVPLIILVAVLGLVGLRWADAKPILAVVGM